MMYRESTPLAVSPMEAPSPGRGVRKAKRRAKRSTFKARIGQFKCQNIGKGRKCRKK